MVELHTMKIAISVDGQLLEEANRTARQMGLSRSRLFSLAVQQYLRHRSQEQTLEQLNQVYASESVPAERRVATKMKAKFRRTIKDKW
jgi:metal-responsive CopG/Arc/MetJ family transcriptional regulator